MPADDPGSDGRWEDLRRGGAWVTGTLFVVSFVGLLALSATPYWAPDNPVIPLLDQVWKLTGLIALTLGVLPYVLGGARRALRLLSE